jgi:hypothetical protein
MAVALAAMSAAAGPQASAPPCSSSCSRLSRPCPGMTSSSSSLRPTTRASAQVAAPGSAMTTSAAAISPGTWSVKPNGRSMGRLAASSRSSCSTRAFRPATASTWTPASARAAAAAGSGAKPQPLSIRSAHRALCAMPSRCLAAARLGAS